VIIVLLGLITIAIGKASKTSQSAQTRALMNSIKQSLIRFEEDVGYLPPVLGPERELIAPPDPTSPSFLTEIQDWHSATTGADYLVGYGNEQADGYGQPGAPTRTAVGIRHPGTDGVWMATAYGTADGTLPSRNLAPGGFGGKVFGPYLELKDQRLLASTNGDGDLDTGALAAFMPGQGGYDPDDPKVIVDYWGKPIRFYRRVYAPGSLGSDYRDGTATSPSLADVFVLRPFDVGPGEAINVPGREDRCGDPTATRALRAARFALFSAGPDRSFNPHVRFDEDPDTNPCNPIDTSFFNKDNIVELGP
jgi:hypothetical protein